MLNWTKAKQRGTGQASPSIRIGRYDRTGDGGPGSGKRTDWNFKWQEGPKPKGKPETEPTYAETEPKFQNGKPEKPETGNKRKPISKISKKSKQGSRSIFEFLERCLKHADIRRVGRPLGTLHTLATEKFKFRVIALERDLLDCLDFIFRNLKYYTFRVFKHDKQLSRSNLHRFYWAPYAADPMPILWILNKNFKMMVSRPLYDQIRH